MSYWNTDFKPLIDRTLRSVGIAAGGTELVFSLDGEEIVYGVEADCCSETWIEHITVPGDINGAVVLRVSDSGSVDATPEQYEQMREEGRYPDSVEVYHTSFATDRGEIIVEYRNNSNGYYGGCLYGPVRRTKVVS